MYRSAYYKQLISVWLLFFIVSFYLTARLLIDAATISGNLFFLTLFLVGAIQFFVLNLLKDLGFFFNSNKFTYPLPKQRRTKRTPRVEIIYYTKNDFSAKVVTESIKQSYQNVSPTILDASTKSGIKSRISFVTKRLKRVNRLVVDPKQKKEAVINEYLKKSTASFVVILGNDGYLSRDYIKNALPYFSVKKVVAVQPHKNVISSKREYAKIFATGGIGSSQLYQKIRHIYGFLPIRPQGSMFRRKLLLTAGGFDHLRAEDLELSLALRKKRYLTRYAENVEYVVTNHSSAWTIRHGLILLANLRNIYDTKMKRHEKMDIVLFLHNFKLKTVTTIYYLLYLSLHFIMYYGLHYTLKMESSYFVVAGLPWVFYSYIFCVVHERQIIKLLKKTRTYSLIQLKEVRPYFKFSSQQVVTSG